MNKHKHHHHGRRGNPEIPFGMPFFAMGRGFEDWADFGWGERGRGRGGRGRRGRMFGGGELRLVLLKLIADEPRHGYELMKALEDLTEGAYSPSPGTIYPTLSLLADEGAIEECLDEGTRKAFAATDAGKAELEEKAEEVEALMARLSDVGTRRGKQRSPELMRAVSNLRSVLRNKIASGEVGDKAVEGIVDLIDEVAKRIERL